MTPGSGFVAELRRRSVFKVSAVYAGMAFVLWQAADIAFPALGLPEWSVTLVVALTLTGFPVAVVLAWAYELTSQGIVRTPATRGGTEPERSAERGADTGAVDGAAAADSTPAAAAPAEARRLAILPLANIHADRDQDYFADGMTEELISVISRIRGLDVIARTSVMTYRNTDKSVARIGAELDVGTVLEGSVRKAGDQLRVTVQLIDVATQSHLWSHDYDRELREVFQVQSDIARHVADALEVALLGAERTRLEHVPTESVEVYDLYLLGRHRLNKRSDAGLKKAVEYFEKALGLDPTFAMGYAGLADAYVLAGIGYAAIPEAFDRAHAAATKAVELDEGLAEAHTSLGYALLNRDWDWASAERELRRAIELSPSNAQAHQWLGHVALYRRRWDEARGHLDRAVALDPRSALLVNESGWPPMYAGDFIEGLARSERAIELDPSFGMAHFNLGGVCESTGDLERAETAYREAMALSPGVLFMEACMGRLLARLGRSHEARAHLDALVRHGGEGAPTRVWRAVIHEALGDRERALDLLEEALEVREPQIGMVHTNWMPLPSLVDEPRFRAVMGATAAAWGFDPETD